MPYEIKWEKEGVIVHFTGTFSYGVNTEANMALYSNPRFENLKYIIWDLSGVIELNMNEAEAHLSASHDRLAASRLPKVKMALYAQDKKIQDLCNSYVANAQVIGLGWDFMVSNNMEEIRSWTDS